MTQNSDPINLYRAKVEAGAIRDDPAQRLVVEKLSLLARRLNEGAGSAPGFARALFGWGRERVEMKPLEGLYIYGQVGRGKTMLMDLFAGAVTQPSWRVHFLEFMRDIHAKLSIARGGKSGEPLIEVADEIAKTYRLLCLDEMQVENIADAMILGRLFERLFEKGVVLVTTSNRHPDELYKGGLNRHRFLPFLDTLKDHTEIISLDGMTDYRLGASEADQRYFAPLNDETEAEFMGIWAQLPANEAPMRLAVGTREWSVERTRDDAALIAFDAACVEARGANDYDALAKRFATVFLDNVPKLTKENTSAARRFITLIDVFYEEGTRLYLRSECAIEDLHADENSEFIWDRTLSRLYEMRAR